MHYEFVVQVNAIYFGSLVQSTFLKETLGHTKNIHPHTSNEPTKNGDFSMNNKVSMHRFVHTHSSKKTRKKKKKVLTGTYLENLAHTSQNIMSKQNVPHISWTTKSVFLE